jgi:hypothetical protein
MLHLLQEVADSRIQSEHLVANWLITIKKRCIFLYLLSSWRVKILDNKLRTWKKKCSKTEEHTGWFTNSVWFIYKNIIILTHYFDWYYCSFFWYRITIQIEKQRSILWESNLCCRNKGAKSDTIRESPCIFKKFHFSSCSLFILFALVPATIKNHLMQQRYQYLRRRSQQNYM